jgi:peptidyl-prolyl cis-trans isomerase D
MELAPPRPHPYHPPPFTANTTGFSMLQQMRVFSKSIFATIFMGIVALSFVVWGIADIFRGRVDTDVVTIGNVAVSEPLFSRDYRNFLRGEGQQLHKDVTPEMARKMGLGNVVLDRIVNRYAIDSIVDGLGLTASDGDVSARIRSMQAFNGPLGGFDRATFERELQQSGFAENEFVEGVRSDIARSQLLGPVSDGARLPSGYARALFAYFTEMRAVEYVVLTPQALGAIPPPSDQVLADYVKAHADRFSTPEYRDVSYAVIAPEDLTASITVTDKQLHDLYDANKSTYVVPEKRHVEQISFATEAEAKAARTRADSGMPFNAVAAISGKTVDDLGDVTQADLGARGAAVFALQQDKVTEPLQNLSGWVLMHVTKITPGSSKSFDDVKAELTKQMQTQIAQGKIVDMGNAFTDAVSGGAEIEAAAKKSGMHYGHITAVDAQGLTPDGTKANLPTDPDLLAQIFKADVGDTTDPFQSSAGRTFAVAVLGQTPPKLRSLASVRADAIHAWTQDQRVILLKKRAADLGAQARRENGLAGVAHALGAPVQVGPPLTRQKGSDIFSEALLKNIFAAPPGGIAVGPLGKGDGYVIAHITGITHPPVMAGDPSLMQGMQQLDGDLQQDITMSLAKAARDKQGVNIHQKNLDQATGSGEGS